MKLPIGKLLPGSGICQACFVVATASLALPCPDATAAESAPGGTVAPASGHSMTVADGSATSSGDGMSGMTNTIGCTHAVVPAGVFGANMVQAHSVMLMYTPMMMGMRENYIGSSTLSPSAIVTQASSLRIVPTSMDSEMHMFHAMYGITDWANVMVMGAYVHKSMTMTTFAGGAGATPLGNSTSSTEGLGDTSLVGLFRIYQDDIHHVHLNLGLSLPSGSITEQATMLSPTGAMMPMRACYGMQLGSGTYDGLYGFTYTGHIKPWSWGAAFRGRAAFDENTEGYRWGPSNELSLWGAYEVLPGLNLTARAAGTQWGRIQGSDSHIFGKMEGANPDYYGGERVEMFGGLEYKLHAFGTPVRLAVEAGAPVYQYLNGPQLGKEWQVNCALCVHF